MRYDYEQYKDADGVIDEQAMQQGVWRRQRARLQGTLFICCVVAGIVGVISTSVPIGIQASSIALGLAWCTGCLWALEARPGTPLARRAGTLMPLAVIPCLLGVLVPLAL